MQNLPMIRSLKAAVFVTMLTVMLVIISVSDPLSAAGALVTCVMIMPPLMTITALWAGLLPAAVSWVAAVLLAWLPYGPEAGLRMILFLMPMTVAFFVCVHMKKPFFTTALVMSAAELLGGFSVLLILNRQSDGRLAEYLAEQYVLLIEGSKDRDDMLIMLMQTGMARLDPKLYGKAQNLFGSLTELGRQELMLTFRATLTDVLADLPALLVRCSIWHSLAGLGIGIYFGRRSVIRQVVDTRRRELLQRVIDQRRAQLERGEMPDPEVRLESKDQLMRELSGDCEQALGGFPTMQMPPFSRWYLPRKIGLMVALPGLGYLVAAFSDAPQAQLVGSMLGTIFTVFYTIQGMAAMDFALGQAGRQLGFRCIMIGLTTLLFSRIFLVIGIIDQLLNFRKLRPAIGETR